MYQVSAAINDVYIKEVSLDFTYQMDPDAVLDATDIDTKMIFICSPNNPTGNCMAFESIRKVVDQFSGIVVVDEAYIDFTYRNSLTHKLGDHPNLVVLQTLSKAWGMAALRIGMAFASAEIIKILNRIKPPYNINSASQKLALEALSNVNMKNDAVGRILKQREWLRHSLNELKVVTTVYPSDANFLLVKVADARKIYEHLVKKMIIVRDRSNVRLCEDALRITVGTEKENKILIETLQSFNV